MKKPLLRLALLALCIGLHAHHAQAGTACHEQDYDASKFMHVMEYSLQVRQALDDSGARVAIMARVGQDLSKYHLYYSHVGIVRKMPDGQWLVLHELNECGTAESSLYNEGIGNFFLDDIFRFDSLLIIPSDALQTALLQRIDNGQAKKIHEQKYNMLSYAYSTRYQNSNQWVLETLAAASDNNVQTREDAQHWLKLHRYQPETLDIPAVTRLGARMFKANISFDDHPFDRRMSGKIDTVSVESITRFMQQTDPQHLELRIADKTQGR